MRVKLVYRNYKPLHKVYGSLVALPPKGVEYVVPPARDKFRKLYPVYIKVRYLPAGRFLIRMFERLVFTKKADDSDIDLYQYINMIDEKLPKKPYIVDIEHAASLLSFSPNTKRMRLVKNFLGDPLCKSIDCMSEAAKRSLQRLLGKGYSAIAHKVHVIYPAQEIEDFQPDYTHIPKNSKALQVLFVGNNVYLKGLHEVLEAVKSINRKFTTNKLQLHVVAADADALLKEYSLPNVKSYLPKFSKEEIFSMFFIPADVFVLPTKQDTFGMSYLDAFASGTPVIATDQFAVPELVDNKKDGLLIHLDKPSLDSLVIPDKNDNQKVITANLNQKTVKELTQTLEKILLGKVDLKKMGQLGKQKFKPGHKFSIDVRNKKILEVYKKALG